MNQKTDHQPQIEHLQAAVEHVKALIHSDSAPVHAAEGLLHSLVFMIGSLVGDAELPEHARASYEGLLEVSRELLWKLRGR
ncbi:MAG: hypothetical protein JOY84_13010 [Curvibacter sp.]|nr:hypothetical protein [Curvibacter sp.]